MKHLMTVGLLVAVAACGGRAPAVGPIAPPTTALPEGPTPTASAQAVNAPDDFRRKAPKPGDALQIDLPEPEVFTLKNGTKVYLIERHDLPIVSVRLVSRHDGVKWDCPKVEYDPQRKVQRASICVERLTPGARSFAAAMLEQGTKTYNALQLSDAFESIGAQHGAWADWDSMGAFIKVTRDQLDKGLDLLAEVALHPTFPKAEFDRLRTRRLAGVRAEKDSLPAMGSNAVAHSVFRNNYRHSYGHSLGGSPAEVEALGINDLRDAYRAAIVQGEVAFLVAGDIRRQELHPMLEQRFSKLPRREPVGGPDVLGGLSLRLRTPAVSKAVIVDKSGATQSYVAFALLGPSAHTHDRDVLALMNVILGGSFSSRVNMNLREKHAYTYGARSRFAMRQRSGLFTIGGNFFADKTGAAIQEILTEFDKIQEEPVTEEELRDARESILLALPGRMESVMELGSMAADLFIYGYKADELRTLPERLAKVTIADVQRVAKAHLAKEDLYIVVVGDKAKVLPQLEPVEHHGNRLHVTELDPWGEPLKGTVK